MAAEFGAFPKLGEILVAEGFVTQEQLDSTLSEASDKGYRIGEALIALGLASEENVYFGLAKQMDFPFFSNEQLLETKEDVVRLIPEDFAKENTLLAVRKDDDRLTVAMADPDDIIAIDNLQKLASEGISIEMAMASP